MSWFRSFALGLLAGGLALAAWTWYPNLRRAADVTDLSGLLETATVKRPNADVFSIENVSIADESRRSIAMTHASRLAWDVTPVAGEWIEVDLGLREAAWASEAHAVLFRVGVSYEAQYDDLISRVVNPAAAAEDRTWIPVRLDLSSFAGRRVSLIFNTAPAPGPREGHTHYALWGAPTLVRR